MSNEDLTQDQTEGGQSTSRERSMQVSAPPADVPGYRLERFLGSGAFGQVWVGRDLNTGRPVAVKFFLHRGGVNWSLLSHEVKNLVQLSADRHIVQVLEVGWDSDPPFYVMELITGGSLEDLLSDRGALPVEEAVELFRQICVGLNHSHSKGVLHCDLKPANILLGEDNEPRLADFGQSRMTHDQTPSLGTLFYMAPEQADLNSSPSSSWDVYAVGAIVYRMLTGGPPYRDDSIVERLDTAGSLPKRLQRYRESIQKASPPHRHFQRTGVDRMLSRIVSRCLAPDPADRFTTIQEILQHLDERDESRARRPLMLLGVLGPILLLIATSIFAARTINRASRRTTEALQKEASSANLLAAKFAARSLEVELDRYFRLCRDEMSLDSFRQKMSDALNGESVSRPLAEIAATGTSERAGSMTDARNALLDAQPKQILDDYLAERLEQYTVAERTPRLASMFVTDSSGTIFGIAYDPPVSREANSSGRNYAYRTYFHGGDDDLSKQTAITSIDPLSEMHLSAAFQSTATGLWKVAISAPVYLDADPPENATPDAVFVITINLGDFELLQGSNQVAVLIDAREGTVLQHPFLESRFRADKPYRDELKVDPADLKKLLRVQDVTYTYRDPVAQADEGAAQDAQQYAGNWIAALQSVALPSTKTSNQSVTDREAGLMVLVQYQLRAVEEPVDVMRRDLLWEGAAALGSILIVSATLWFFVHRVRQDQAVQQKGGRSSLSTALGSNAENADTNQRSGSDDPTETLSTPRR
ncbi:MAG: serine/threonine protein kinase [Planctomycetota bacterium]